MTQVWFQNSRARQKKHIHAGKTKSNYFFNETKKFIKFFLSSVFLVPRDADGNNYGRHINLQLTYSFQNNTHNSLHLNNNNNNNNSKASLYNPHGRYIQHIFIDKRKLFQKFVIFIDSSSLDELSQDSSIHCMQSEV